MIPFIFGAIALGSVAMGVTKGIEGHNNMSKAKEIAEDAQERYEEACRILEEVRQNTNDLAAKYGEYQMYLKQDTVGRFVKLVNRLKRKISIQDFAFFNGFEGISLPEIESYQAEVSMAEDYFKAVGGAAVGGLATSSAVTALATSIGVASTGTAISGLSGAAATNATLAWLGGGSLATGGGGMALGSLVLGGITLGPALAVGGFMIAGQGEKALTQALKYEAKVAEAIAQIQEGIDFLQLVQERIIELENILNQLEEKAHLAMDKLEKSMIHLNLQITGNAEIDAEIFQETALLIKAIMEIMRTPVLDGEGKLNPVTAQIKVKYRNLIA
jgi:hypothetical protein